MTKQNQDPRAALIPSLDLERCVIGAALCEPEYLGIDMLAPQDIHAGELRTVWRVIHELRGAGRPPDYMTVLSELERRDLQYPATVLANCQEALTRTALTPETYQSWVRTLRELAQRRVTFDAAQRMVQIAVKSNGTFRDDALGQADFVRNILESDAQPTHGARAAVRTFWTADELLSTSFPDPPWAVPDLVPVGLTLLAGRPKVGKSWLALQIAIAASCGGKVLDRDVLPRKVLYVALEDGPRRLKNRLQKLGGVKSGATLNFVTSWRCLQQGGLEDLERAITREGYTLVVLDTLARALGAADQGDLADMTVLVGGLQELAMRHDVTVLVVDHHRKPAGTEADPIDDVIGSSAKSAVCDAALGLYKEQGKRGATLKVTGRELEEQSYTLSWDAVTCGWQMEGTTEEVNLRGNKTKILDALRNAEEPLTLTELAGQTGMGKNNVLPLLNELINGGHVERCQKQGREVPYRAK